jgi:hypothetical protein
MRAAACNVAPASAPRLVQWSLRIRLPEMADVISRVIIDDTIGVWRSLVAHLHGVQGVEGSNPFTPTIFDEG